MDYKINISDLGTLIRQHYKWDSPIDRITPIFNEGGLLSAVEIWDNADCYLYVYRKGYWSLYDGDSDRCINGGSVMTGREC